MTFANQNVDGKTMDEIGMALEIFASSATVAAETSCEMQFHRAAVDFLSRLKAKVSGTSTSQAQLQLEGRKPPSMRQLHLWRLLRHLPSQDRRQFIEDRLSEAERRQLEHWILAERAKQGSRIALPNGFSLRSLCRWKGRSRCKVGYRPILHLHDSLYAQASFTFDLTSAVRALGTLLAMRAAAEEAMTVEKMHSAITAVMERSDGSTHKQRATFYFKTRVKIGHGREVASPARRSLAMALKEWRSAQLLRSEAAVLTGRADRVTREALECCKRQKMAAALPWLKGITMKRSRRSRVTRQVASGDLKSVGTEAKFFKRATTHG